MTSAFFKVKDPVSNRQRQQLAFISEFATDITHVPGLLNVVADALTRQYDDERASAVVHSIVHSLLDVDLAELAAEQQPLVNEPPSSLVLKEIRFPGVDHPVVCDTSRGTPLVLVPSSRRKAIFDAVHELAHPSGKATLAIMAKTYVWQGMRRDVVRWAKQCVACQTSKISVHMRPPVLPIPVPKTRFEHVHVDLVGPLTPDRGFKYLLTIIDRTTIWPELVPIADTASETVLQAFLDHWISRYGVPGTLTSDRGAQFTSEVWRKSLARLGICVSATTAYHPQANGVIERFHRTLKNALRCAVRASKSWSRSLPWVLLGLRNSPKMETSTSVAEVVFGTPLRVPGICFQVEQAKGSTAAEQLELARKNVADFTPETLDLRRFRMFPFVAKTLCMATHVFVRDDRLGKSGLAPKYVGPYKVLHKDWDNSTFRLALGNKEDTLALARLKAAAVSDKATWVVAGGEGCCIA